MKKINNKPLPKLKKERFDGIAIGEEWAEEERIEYICPSCHQNLVKISDRQGNNEEWFCRNCSIPYLDTKEIRHRHKLSVPLETEPAVSIINYDYNKDMEIRHPKELRGGIAELQKRGMKIIYFEDSSQR
jgi:hypothetical protein